MNANPMDALRQWALQTVTFAMTVENAAATGISQEVVEQTAIPASRISNQFFAESTAACGVDAERVDRVFPELVKRVLDWVADHRKHHAHADKEGDPHSPHVGHGSGLVTPPGFCSRIGGL